MAKIAINGFGRIGRLFFRAAFNNPDLNIVAINDLGDKDNLLYLLKYDSVYGRYDPLAGGAEKINEVKFLQEKEPAKLPWKKPLHTFLMITCDLLAGFLIVYLLSGNKLLALAGGLAAIAPDFINGLYIFPRLTGTKLFKLERFIHADAAHFWDNKKIPLFWRIFSQALALSIAVFFLQQ